MDNPIKISVIICTFNREKYISEAIDSVLKQTYPNFEIIVIDDASTDNTEQVLTQYKNNPKIKIFKNEQNLGISKSRNRGVSLATGEYIAMLDSDDYWTDTKKLEKQAEILNKNKDVAIVGSSIRVILDRNSKLEELQKYKYKTRDVQIRKKMLGKNQIAQSSVLFRKNVFEEFGGYDESYEVAEDFDLWLKIGRKYKFANLKEITVDYRVHYLNISESNALKIAKITDTLIEKYKNDYPRYPWAKIKSLLRISFASLFIPLFQYLKIIRRKIAGLFN